MAMMLRCCYASPEAIAEAEASSPFAVREDCRDDAPITRFRIRPGVTLSVRRWNASLSEDGQIDIAGVLQRVQRGGVHPTIKGVVWEFLLGCYDPKSTWDQRDELRQARRAQYEMLKSKCQEMEKAVGSGKVITAPVITDDGQPIEPPEANGDGQPIEPPEVNGEVLPVNGDIEQHPAVDGEEPSANGGTEVNGYTEQDGQQTDRTLLSKEIIQWKLTLHQIGLDVVRTDRLLVYYESLTHQSRLWDILAVYSWYDKDIGYCQGMSDLCSPISILVEDEADAFWCFERLMRRVRPNFKATTTTIGVRAQLGILSTIMKAVNPTLHEHIEKLDGGEYLFAFRMLMVLFRREFSVLDSIYLWELMLSMEYNPSLFSSYESGDAAYVSSTDESFLKQCGKFEKRRLLAGQSSGDIPLSIFIMASIIETRGKRLLNEAKGLDDIVKILNDVTGSLDARKACRKALKIQKKYLANLASAVNSTS